MRPSLRAVPSALFLAFVALLPGCLSSSQVECVSGTVRCGDTCVATQTDNNNCGSCGSACSAGNVCVAGACVCPVGQGVCSGICTTIATDPNNCGACGVRCGQGFACNQGVCQDCTAGGCQNVQVLAGCIATPGGYLVPIEDAPGGLLVQAPMNPPGATFPDALGLLGGALLYADHDSSTLFEVPVGALNTASSERVSLVGSTTGSKAGTTQVYVEPSEDGGSLVYAMASSVNALRIFGGPAADQAANLLDAGAGAVGALGLQNLGGAAFDPGSFPEPFAKVGTDVFVPLNGTGKVLRLDVSNPASAVLKDTFDLQPLVAALPGGGTAPDGGPFLPSPTQAIARNGIVYVAANVLRFYADFSGADYGPPLVVRIDPSKSGAAALSAVAGLGADAGCQNVEWLEGLPAGTSGAPMLVSCAGARTYDQNFDVKSVKNTALLLLDGADQPVAAWVPSNGPIGADGGPPPPSVGRAVGNNGTVYVADETISRLYVLRVSDSSLIERVGYIDGGTPPQVCPNFITDLLVTPAQ
jgi:hypothetical protein